jgi:hypothetical protein
MSNASFAALIAAYKSTQYRIFRGTETLTFHIGQRSMALCELHASLGVSTSAFITAWNPSSVAQALETNNAAHESLVREVANLGLRALPGEGVDPASLWAAEPSLLILGIDRRCAEEIGRHFGQIAIVFTAEDCIPELIVTLCNSE